LWRCAQDAIAKQKEVQMSDCDEANMQNANLIRVDSNVVRLVILYHGMWNVTGAPGNVEKYIEQYRDQIDTVNRVFAGLGLVMPDVNNPVGFRATSRFETLIEKPSRAKKKSDSSDVDSVHSVMEVAKYKADFRTDMFDFLLSALLLLDLDQRFRSSNHIKRPYRACKSRCERRGLG
jgi:hypothetical protein